MDLEMNNSKITEENSITVNTIQFNGDLIYNNKILLSYKIAYPEFDSALYRKSVSEVNIYYKTSALKYQKHCETILFNQAIEQYKNAIKYDYPLRLFEAALSFRITYLASCIISLTTDTYEYTGGAHGNTFRNSQTFNLQKGYTINLSHLVHCIPDYKSYLLQNIIEKAAKEPDAYFEEYEKLITTNFDKNNFYCTTQGIVLYFQQYGIAPYVYGIKEFEIPYSSCVLNPENLCYLMQ